MTRNAKIMRGVLIGLMAVAVGWFGWRVGPRPRPAEAKVFERLVYFTRAMPAYRFDREASSAPRKTRFNGNTAFLTVGTSSDSIAGILDFYEAEYPPTPVQPLDPQAVEMLVAHYDDRRIKESLPVVADFLKCFNSNVRIERGDWGLWGSFQLHDQSLEIGGEALMTAMQKAFDSGNLGDLGTARIAIAMKDPLSGITKVLNIWTDRDFNLKNLLPDARGDVAGNDIEAVPRYPNSQRVLSMEQENTGTSDRIVAYEGGGSAIGHILFYRSRMKNAGWRADAFFEAQMKKQSQQNILFYRRDDRECMIQIHQDDESRKIITVVVDRKTRSS